MRFNLARLKRQLEELTGREYSWSEIARRTALHRHTIERIAANQTRQVRLETLERLIAFFHAEGMPITVNDLFTDVDTHLELPGLLQTREARKASEPVSDSEPDVMPVYTNVPPPVKDFTGRLQELEAICALFQNGYTCVVVYGEEVGKTELALAVAHQLKPYYPHVHLFVDLQPHGRPASAEALLRRIVQALRSDGPMLEALSDLQSLYRRWLRPGTWRGILILDDAVHAGQVVPLLPPPEGYIVLVTSRHPLSLPDAATYAVGPLSLPDATALLRRLLREGGRPDLTGPEHAANLRRLAELCHFRPLPLRLLAAHLAASPKLFPERLLEILEAECARYSSLGAESSTAAAVHLCLEALAEEDPELVRCWHLLTLFNSPFRAEEAAILLERPHLETEFLLARLVERRLLDHRPDQNLYQIHRAVRRHAFAFPVELDTHALERARLRFARYFLERAQEAEALYQEGADTAQAVETFDAIWPHLQAAWEWMRVREAPDAFEFLNVFPQVMNRLLDLRLPARERIPIFQAALGAARRLGKRDDESVHLSNLGGAYFQAGELNQAVRCYEEALRIDRETGDVEGEAVNLFGLANTLYRRGEIHTAIEYYHRALEIVRQIDNRTVESSCLVNLGTAYLDLGDTSRAIELYEEALRLDREMGNRRGESTDLGNLGNVYYRLDRIPEAISCYEQALEIAREVGDRRAVPRLLGNLATAYFRQGEWERSLELYEQALELAREAGDRSTEGFVLGSLGVVHRAMGRLQRAVQYYHQALELAREIGDRRAEAVAAWNLGLAYEQLGEYRRAVELMEIAVAYERDVNSPDFERDAHYLERVRRLAAEEK